MCTWGILYRGKLNDGNRQNLVGDSDNNKKTCNHAGAGRVRINLGLLETGAGLARPLVWVWEGAISGVGGWDQWAILKGLNRFFCS